MTRTNSSLVAALVGAAVLGGCGPTPRLLAADDTLMVAMAAVDESDQVIASAEADAAAGAESARQAHHRAKNRLEEAHGVVQTWRDTGSGELAWVTLSPCLAAALIGLRMTLEAAGLGVPEDLPQAETMAAEPNGDECRSEPRPTISTEPPSAEASTPESREEATSDEPSPSSEDDPDDLSTPE